MHFLPYTLNKNWNTQGEQKKDMDIWSEILSSLEEKILETPQWLLDGLSFKNKTHGHYKKNRSML